MLRGGGSWVGFSTRLKLCRIRNLYTRNEHGGNKGDKELEEKKKKEEEQKAREEAEQASLEEQEKSKSDEELAEVKARLGKIEETIKEIVVVEAKQRRNQKINQTRAKNDWKNRRVLNRNRIRIKGKSVKQRQIQMDQNRERCKTEELKKLDERPGEQWISLKRKFGDSEDIKIEATMIDGSVPVSKSASGEPEDLQLHITFIVNISKGDEDETLEIMCSAWPDTIEIMKLFIRRHGKSSAHPYLGPEFEELDDELQNSLYDFLEARGISDDLAVFLHQYMKNKDKAEYVRWMETVKSYIEQK